MVNMKPATETKSEIKQKQQAAAYDVIIIGAGLAGLSCALQAAQRKLRVALIESQLPGGKLLKESVITDWPGFKGSGLKLVNALLEQLRDEPLVSQIQGQAVKLHALHPLYAASLDEGKLIHGRTLVIATGDRPHHSLLKDFVKLTEAGYVVASEETRTPVPGVYVIGDARDKLLRHMASAACDGITAATLIAQYLR